MSASSLPHALPVHPHQIEVQEFDSYALIVDLRPAEAYAIDHIPRAVSAPWPIDAGPPVRTQADATTIDAASAAMEARQGLPYALEARLASLSPGSAVLLYCDQGGAISSLLAPGLVARGLAADVLPGGWASYRRWVGAGVEVLARSLDWRWVRSPPGGVSQALVHALHGRGEQVLEVGALFDQVLMPGLISSPAAVDAPSLESRLVDALRRLDPGLAVWADEVDALSGDQVLPTPLHEALRSSSQWRVDASIDCRVDMVHAWLKESGETVAGLLDGIGPALAGSLASALGRVRDLEARCDEHQALSGLLREVLDPIHDAVAAPGGAGRERVVQLPSSAGAAADQLAAQLAGTQINP